MTVSIERSPSWPEKASGCNNGRPYNVSLKLTGCKETEFTCSDGQCIEFSGRCDQILHCRDKSDEAECRVLVLEEGYNKNIPPVTQERSNIIIKNFIRLFLIDCKLYLIIMRVINNPRCPMKSSPWSSTSPLGWRRSSR